MILDIMSQLEKKAKSCPKKVLFPEAQNPIILKAAKKALDNKIASPILVGSPTKIREASNKADVDINDMTIISNDDECLIGTLAEEFYIENQIFSVKKLNRVLKNPLYFAAMMLHRGQADAMVAGIDNTTADVILASQVIVGLQKGISVPSSIFLMNIPSFEGSEGNLIVLADGGVCEDPNPSELADIAITTAQTTEALLGWEPRIALLSYSTKGSVESDATKKVIDALNFAKERQPNLLIDGELQLDAAIVPEIATKKVGSDSPVAGKANILIVPDLNVGNILYKGIQRFAKADAYGPFLQGFAKTVSDLSRGSSVEDVYGVIIMAVVRAKSL